MLNNNKIEFLLFYPKKKFIFQTKNLVKISGSFNSKFKYKPEHIFIKIGKRVVDCEDLEENQFWFQFRTGKGFKLIRVFFKYSKKTIRIKWFLLYIKSNKNDQQESIFKHSCYLNWLKKYQFHNIENILSRKRLNNFKISIVSFIKNKDLKYIKDFIYSVENQNYKNFELLFCSSKKLNQDCLKDYKIFYSNNTNISATLDIAIRSSTGDIIFFLSPNTKLNQYSLSLISLAFENSKVVLAYGDEDSIGQDYFRCNPNFKTSFDPIRIINQNYIGNNFAARKHLIPNLESLNKFGDDINIFHSLILKIKENRENSIIHIPYIIYSTFLKYSKKINNTHLKSNIKGNSSFELIKFDKFLYYRPKLVNHEYQVSIIIPSACNLKYLQPCIQSLLSLTSYKKIEVIIIVNEIRFFDKKIKKYLLLISKFPNFKIIKYRNKRFNYSKVINLGVSKANSDYICLMNDDIEIISPNWLEELLSWLLFDSVGAVGAKLLYPDNSIQHAGITIGVNGVCDHLEKNALPSDYNSHSRLDYPRCFSAVTAGCMLTTKKIFNAVNGFDEKLPLTYNDVDFCLRLKEAGYRIVFSPFSVLYHHESVSVTEPTSFERKQLFRKELTYFLTKHENNISVDPHYSPNHSDIYPYFKLALPPRITKFASKFNQLSWDKRYPLKQFEGNSPYLPEKVVIYSHYDVDNIIDNYVVKSLQELRNLNWTIIFVTSSNNLSSGEVSKIKNLVNTIICSNGRGRDWGNFALGLRYTYTIDFPESLLLMNDSLYGPFNSLKELFDRIQNNEADFIGLTDSFQHCYHLQSYFIYCKPSICKHITFLNFWKNFYPLDDKNEIIYKNEMGFTKYFMNLGFDAGCLFTYDNLLKTALNGSYSATQKVESIDKKTFLNPTHYFADILFNVYDFPFIKIELLKINPSKVPNTDLLLAQIKENYPDYYKLIIRHLKRVSNFTP